MRRRTARYKMVDRHPRLLPIVLESKRLPGSFEHAPDFLIDTEIDLSGMARRQVSGETGAPACDSTVLLKIVLSPTAAEFPAATNATRYRLK